MIQKKKETLNSIDHLEVEQKTPSDLKLKDTDPSFV